MGEPKFPVVFAVGLWAASGLAVLTYTVIAYRETANGLESGAMTVLGQTNGLVASANVLDASLGIAPDKPLERGKFRKSQGQ